MFIPSEFPKKPFQSVCPVDQVQMTDAYDCSLVFAPSTRRNANKAVVRRLFNALDDIERGAEYGPGRRL